MTQQGTSLQVIDEKQATALAQRGFGNDWRSLSPVEQAKTVMLVQQGFNPLTDLCVYRSKPYVTVDGWYNAVPRAGRRVGRMLTYPIRAEERELYLLQPDEVGFVSHLYLEGDSQPFCFGIGKASREHPLAESKRQGAGPQPEELHPARIAEKRAEAQALRKAIRMLGFAVSDVGTMGAGGVVVESSARDVTDEEPAAAPGAQEDADEHDEIIVRAAQVRTLGDLYNFAMTTFGKDRYPDRLTILNRLGKRMNEITDADAPDLARRLVEITTGRLV